MIVIGYVFYLIFVLIEKDKLMLKKIFLLVLFFVIVFVEEFFVLVKVIEK